MATKKKALGSPGARDAKEFLDELRGRPMALGDYLAAVRDRDGETQTAFAGKLGITRGNLCDIEKGRRPVSLKRAAEWAKTLRLPPERMVELAIQQEVLAAGLEMKVAVRPTLLKKGLSSSPLVARKSAPRVRTAAKAPNRTARFAAKRVGRAPVSKSGKKKMA